MVVGGFGDIVDIVDVLGDIGGDQLHVIDRLIVDLAVLTAAEQVGDQAADQDHGKHKADNEAGEQLSGEGRCLECVHGGLPFIVVSLLRIAGS